MATPVETIRNRIKQHVTVRAGDLVPHELNFRRHPDSQRAALQGLYDQIGFARSLLAYELPNGQLKLVDGHLRQAIDPDMMVTVEVLDLTDDEARLMLASTDPLAAMAEADGAALAALLKSVESESEAVNAMLKELSDANPMPLPEAGAGGDEFDPTPDNGPTRTHVGDVWVIGGKHRLLVGDCTDPANVAILMAGATPFLMVTDPPYGVDLDQSWRDAALGDKAMGPGNKNLVQNDDRADWSAAYKLFPGDVCYVWHAGKFSDIVMGGLRDSGFDICQQLIWNKSIMVMGRSDYHFKHEPCWYAVRKGKSHGWIGDRTQTTVIDAASPNHIMSGSKEDKTEHPTQKPLDCSMRLIRNHKGDVYDPFLGSGTTLIAAHRLDRICYGCEIEPRYADVILKRAEAEGLTVEKDT